MALYLCSVNLFCLFMKNLLLPALHSLAGNCVNLRPDSLCPERCLVPALPPAVIASRSWRVIGIFYADDGRVTELMADGQALGATSYHLPDSPPEPYIVAEGLEENITGSYRCRDGFMILTSARMYHAVYDDESFMLRVEQPVAPADYPVITTSVASETSLSIPIAGFKLSGSYSAPAVSLDATDAARLSKALYDAYSLGSSDATASGQLIAPVFARYRLLDLQGNIIFESVPKLHVPTGRHDSSMTTTLNVDSQLSMVSAGSMSLPLFRLDVKLPAATGSIAESRVARIEIQLTPQLHRPDGNLSATHRLSASGLDATMPGCDSYQRFLRMVRQALAGCDSLFETVLSIDNPFATGALERTVNINATARTVDEEKRLIDNAKIQSHPLWLTRCMKPHSVTATTGYRDGEVTLLANPCITLYDGHTVEYFTNHGTLTDDVETVAAVTFSDGRRVVSHSLSRSWKSLYLSPVIVYPDPEAISIELQLCDSTGTNRYIKLPLTRCGRFACYINTDLKPIVLDNGENAAEFYLPIPKLNHVNYPGNIIAFTGDMLSGRETGNGNIKAILPAARPSTSAWESSRSRYAVMGTGGIYSLSLNKLELMMPVLIDSRPVMRCDAVAPVMRDGSGACIYAIAGNDLIEIDGTRVNTIIRSIDAEMLAWCPQHGELLIIPPSDDPDTPSRSLVMHTDSGGWSTRLLPPVSHCYSSPSLSRLTSQATNTLYDLQHDVESPVRCIYTTCLKKNPRHIVRTVPFIDEITIDLTGESISGTITLNGHHGRGPWRILSRLIIDGTLNRPVTHHTLMPARYRMSATLDAILSPDSRLHDSFNIITHEPQRLPL